MGRHDRRNIDEKTLRGLWLLDEQPQKYEEYRQQNKSGTPKASGIMNAFIAFLQQNNGPKEEKQTKCIEEATKRFLFIATDAAKFLIRQKVFAGAIPLVPEEMKEEEEEIFSILRIWYIQHGGTALSNNPPRSFLSFVSKEWHDRVAGSLSGREPFEAALSAVSAAMEMVQEGLAILLAETEKTAETSYDWEKAPEHSGFLFPFIPKVHAAMKRVVGDLKIHWILRKDISTKVPLHLQFAKYPTVHDAFALATATAMRLIEVANPSMYQTSNTYKSAWGNYKHALKVFKDAAENSAQFGTLFLNRDLRL